MIHLTPAMEHAFRAIAAMLRAQDAGAVASASRAKRKADRLLAGLTKSEIGDLALLARRMADYAGPPRP